MKLSFALSLQPTKFGFISVGDTEKSLKFLKETGYDGVELAIREPSSVDAEKLKSIARELDLSISAIGTGQAFVDEGLSFSDPEEKTRKKAIERIKAQIILASKVNAPVIIGLIRGAVARQNSGVVIDCLKECGECAKKKNVQLLIEPINRKETDFINNVFEAKEVIGKLGNKNFKILLDTFHMNMEEKDIIDSIEACRDYIGHVHIADDNRCSPGTGKINFRKIVDCLKKINYDKFLSAEVSPRPSMEEAAVITYKNIHPLII